MVMQAAGYRLLKTRRKVRRGGVSTVWSFNAILSKTLLVHVCVPRTGQSSRDGPRDASGH